MSSDCDNAVATGSTYFANTSIHFPDLLEEKNNEIPIEPFLHACSGVVEFVSYLGTAFAPVRHDISGNVEKIKAGWTKQGREAQTLQSLIEYECKQSGDNSMGIMTDALLWLKRALEFMAAFLNGIIQDYRLGARSRNLGPFCRAAYEQCLRRHHNWLAQKLFGVLILALPYREDLLATLCDGRTDLEDQCCVDLENYLKGMQRNVDVLVEFYVEQKFEEPHSN